MKITVLVDNNTIVNEYFLGEPGFSLLIEIAGKKILFDTGYSDVVIKNAEKLNINLYDIDCLVLSHGHDDHSGGLRFLKDGYSGRKIDLIVAGKEAFNYRIDDGVEFGCPVSENELEELFNLKISEKPFWISDDVVFLGKIPRKNDFEKTIPSGISNKQPDYIFEDSALVVKSEKGLIIITGCSHSGIANICEYAKEICETDSIYSIIGGLHLVNSNDEVIQKTGQYLQKLNLDSLYACHCTGLKAQCCLSNYANLKEIGSGTVLKF